MSKVWEEMGEEAIAQAITNRDVRIRKLMRNSELMVAYICGLHNQPTEKSKDELRAFILRSEGFLEEL